MMMIMMMMMMMMPTRSIKKVKQCYLKVFQRITFRVSCHNMKVKSNPLRYDDDGVDDDGVDDEDEDDADPKYIWKGRTMWSQGLSRNHL